MPSKIFLFERFWVWVIFFVHACVCHRVMRSRTGTAPFRGETKTSAESAARTTALCFTMEAFSLSECHPRQWLGTAAATRDRSRVRAGWKRESDARAAKDLFDSAGRRREQTGLLLRVVVRNRPLPSRPESPRKCLDLSCAFIEGLNHERRLCSCRPPKTRWDYRPTPGAG